MQLTVKRVELLACIVQVKTYWAEKCVQNSVVRCGTANAGVREFNSWPDLSISASI